MTAFFKYTRLIILTSSIVFVSCEKENNIATLITPPPPPPPTPTTELCVRPLINASLVPIGTLPTGRTRLLSAAAANKILFAGGYPGGSSVDIYDLTNNSWSSATLTDRWRNDMAVATVGNKVLFAGGGDGIGDFVSSRVDIYDAVANTWSTTELSSARSNLAAATIGDKVFFAGGWGYPNGSVFGYFNTVDIYDNATNTWTTSTLSEARSDISAITVGRTVYFAGGTNNLSSSTVIDIFDESTGSWSVSNLVEPKSGLGGTFADNKIFWAGGYVQTPGTRVYKNKVEIRDTVTGISSLECLLPAGGYLVAKKYDKLAFFPGYKYPVDSKFGYNFEVYDIPANTWATAVLNQRVMNAAVISVNNTIYVAGGTNGSGTIYNQLWRLEF